jgi:hypothetical protein
MSDLRARIEEFCSIYDEIYLADGFDEAFVGIVFQHPRTPIACYDRQKCVEILMRQGIPDPAGAQEWFDYNVGCSFVGPGTPGFLERFGDEA